MRDKQSVVIEVSGNDIIEFDLDNQDVLLKYTNAPSSSLNTLEKQAVAVHCMSPSSIKCNTVQCNVVDDKVVQCTNCTATDCMQCNITQCHQVKCTEVKCLKKQCNRVNCKQCTNCTYYYN